MPRVPDAIELPSFVSRSITAESGLLKLQACESPITVSLPFSSEINRTLEFNFNYCLEDLTNEL